jgi:hypothetical protein
MAMAHFQPVDRPPRSDPVWPLSELSQVQHWLGQLLDIWSCGDRPGRRLVSHENLLPGEIDAEQVTAKFNTGVLTVVFARPSNEKAKKIKIQ